MIRAALFFLACFGLSACAGQNVGLRDLSTNGAGPDEFSVLPTLPLVIPDDLSALPPPAPGGVNRTDRNPRGEAIAALGGQPAAAFAGGVPAADAALVAAAGRNGVPADIRGTLATEDAQFRGRGRGLGAGFFGGDRYFQAYASQSLDARAELGRFREAGVAVPTVPPSR
jgi:hypothetical protein